MKFSKCGKTIGSALLRFGIEVENARWIRIIARGIYNEKTRQRDNRIRQTDGDYKSLRRLQAGSE